jgi:hypothetical protein
MAPDGDCEVARMPEIRHHDGTGLHQRYRVSVRRGPPNPLVRKSTSWKIAACTGIARPTVEFVVSPYDLGQSRDMVSQEEAR